MIASRVGDGRGDTSIVYAKAPGARDLATAGDGDGAAWLGFVDPVVDVTPVPWTDPTPRPARRTPPTGRGPAARLIGSTERTAEQTAIAAVLREQPGGRCTATPCAATSTPSRSALSRSPACSRGSTRRSPTSSSRAGGGSTTSGSGVRSRRSAGRRPTSTRTPSTDTSWTPSCQPGLRRLHEWSRQRHGSVRRGRPPDAGRRRHPRPPRRGRPDRPYATLTALEHDALNARIWGGLHFRDAMDDGYCLGHTRRTR